MFRLEEIFFYFVFYSVLGWVYETVLCSLEEKKAVNRGFLCGPYCPIYGAGAVLFLLLLGREQSPILIFVLGAAVACALEYLTSFIMEKAYGQRWWDYSERFLNLNGRICLAGAIVFGLFAVLLIKFIHPAVIFAFSGVNRTVFLAIDVAATAVLTFDFILALVGTKKEISYQKKRIEKAYPHLKKTK